MQTDGERTDRPTETRTNQHANRIKNNTTELTDKQEERQERKREPLSRRHGFARKCQGAPFRRRRLRPQCEAWSISRPAGESTPAPFDRLGAVNEREWGPDGRLEWPPTPPNCWFQFSRFARFNDHLFSHTLFFRGVSSRIFVLKEIEYSDWILWKKNLFQLLRSLFPVYPCTRIYAFRSMLIRVVDYIVYFIVIAIMLKNIWIKSPVHVFYFISTPFFSAQPGVAYREAGFEPQVCLDVCLAN